MSATRPIAHDPPDRLRAGRRRSAFASLGPVASRSVWLSLVAAGLLWACAPERQQTALKPKDKSIVLTGTVAPIEKVEVAARVAAVVEEVLVEPGRRVRPGEVVVRFDQTTQRADVARAEATLGVARANLAQARGVSQEAQLAEARAEAERLRQELEREKRLSALPATAGEYETASIVLANARAKLERLYSLYGRRLASKPEIEAAQNEFAEAQRRFEQAQETYERRAAGGGAEVRIAQARYDAARARLRGIEMASAQRRPDPAVGQVRQAEADLTQARYNLAQTTVRAPISGIVTDVKVQRGDKVYERSPLLLVEEINRVQVKAELSPGLLSYVHVGQTARVTINTVPPATVTSSIHGILPVADPKTQSLAVTLVLPNPELKFQPGFSARVEIPVDRTPPATKDAPTRKDAPAQKGGGA
jgi:multidrug resistance efflux pump